MRLRVRVLDVGLQIPSYQHPGDAGLDLRARTEATLGPRGGRALVPTGIAIELPADHVGLVCPRSGLAIRSGVTVLNGPGVVDSSYRGEISVALVNLDPHQSVSVARGDRIAQLLVLPVTTVVLEAVDELSTSERGATGFGDSGRT